MKISASKKQLAKIISENGGWFDGANWAIQGRQSMGVGFSKSKPYRKGDGWFVNNEKRLHHFATDSVLPNWHQTVLARDEYFHLYPAQDADGWIEWRGGERPVDGDEFVVVRVRSGRVWRDGKAIRAKVLRWSHTGGIADIIAYRLHKPEQAKPELCESVMRSTPEPEAKPTIEQLAADYRNAKDYADRKQQEADAAKADAEAKLSELVAAGKAVGLAVSVAAPEPELVITDWRDLQLGDIIEYVDGDIKGKIGMSGPVVEFAQYAADGLYVRLKCDNGPNKGRLGWPRQWRFIRRPAKGDANA